MNKQTIREAEIFVNLSKDLEDLMKKYKNVLDLRKSSLMIMSGVFAHALFNNVPRKQIAEMVKDAMKMAIVLLDVYNSHELKNFEEGVE